MKIKTLKKKVMLSGTSLKDEAVNPEIEVDFHTWLVKKAKNKFKYNYNNSDEPPAKHHPKIRALRPGTQPIIVINIDDLTKKIKSK